MAEVALALAASARSWSDRLHGHLVDHGGARVRTVVMDPDGAVSEDYDVLIIDDICSFLTPRLVEQVRRRGRLVVGVFDPDDGADAKRRLLDCGVEDVIESSASPDEFVEIVARLHRLVGSDDWIDPAVTPPERPAGRVVVVGAPPGGAGATELAVALADEAGGVLVDADDVAPSVAQRLGASLHPNLRTAVDVVHHRSGTLDDVVRADRRPAFVAGLAQGGDWSQLAPGEVEAVVEELSQVSDPLVVNVSSGLERPDRGEGRFGLARALVARADVVVGAGVPSPVGVTRLIRWLCEARALAPDTVVHAVVNRTRRSGYERAEVRVEVERAVPGVEVTFLPDDARVAEAAWAGRPVRRGPYRRAVRRICRVVA